METHLWEILVALANLDTVTALIKQIPFLKPEFPCMNPCQLGLIHECFLLAMTCLYRGDIIARFQRLLAL